MATKGALQEFPGYLDSKFANFCKVPMLTMKVMLFIMLVQPIPIDGIIDPPGGRPLEPENLQNYL